MDLIKKISLFVKDNVDHVQDKYLTIYEDVSKINKDIGMLFANIHDIINFYANDFNARIGSHFNAGDSRDYLKVIRILSSFDAMVKDSEFEFCLDENYKDVLKNAEPHLKMNGGSDLPVDLPRFIIKEYDPILFLKSDNKFRKHNQKSFELILIGGGSYANVYKYKDEDYNQYFAYKKLKKNSSEKEIIRFRQEYNIMKKCENPYLLKVYKYFDEENSYNMEFCNYTLASYIKENNTKISKETRLSILSQFLSGIEYIHSVNLSHRDLSYNNILIKLDQFQNPFVKISDFGLVKDDTQKLTSPDSSIKGTFIDPCLQSFKDYNFKNEIYAIAFIIIFILYGRQNPKKDDCVYPVIEKCLSSNLDDRYDSLQDLKSDLNKYLASF